MSINLVSSYLSSSKNSLVTSFNHNRQISCRPRKKNKVLHFTLACFPIMYAIHLNYKHFMKNEEPNVNFATVMFYQSLQQSLNSVLEKNENHIHCLQRMLHDDSHRVKESKQCKQMINEINTHYEQMIGDEFEFANPKQELIADSTRLKIGATNRYEIGATALEITLGEKEIKLPLEEIRLSFRPKTATDFFNVEHNFNCIFYITLIGLGSFIHLCGLLTMALLNMIRPASELYFFQAQYPMHFIADIADFDCDFNEIESPVVSPKDQVKFLKEQQYQPLLQTDTHNEELERQISQKETFNNQPVQPTPMSKRTKEERSLKRPKLTKKMKACIAEEKQVVSTEKAQPLQTSVELLIQKHHQQMKENNRHPFVAWGSIQSRTVVFLGDIDLDKLNSIYKNASKDALRALTRIVRFQNESGLKYISQNLFELKTVGRRSGSIRYFGGRAFPSKHKNSKGGTDVFYISLERCPELVQMARKK